MFEEPDQPLTGAIRDALEQAQDLGATERAQLLNFMLEVNQRVDMLFAHLAKQRENDQPETERLTLN
jgi:hypothetical protein